MISATRNIIFNLTSSSQSVCFYALRVQTQNFAKTTNATSSSTSPLSKTDLHLSLLPNQQTSANKSHLDYTFLSFLKAVLTCFGSFLPCKLRDQNVAAMVSNMPTPESPSDPAVFWSNAPQAQNQTNQRNRHWQTWPSLRLRLTHLPPNTSTLDVYNNFSQYGSLVRIVIFETRQGDRSSIAEIDYQPVPSRAFWGRPISFDTSQSNYTVRAELAHNQKKNFLIESPTNKDVKYEEKQEIVGDALEFGILSSPELMTHMASCPKINGNSPRLVLNLPRKEIEVCFPFVQTSKNGSKPRKFRFHVALDDELDLWRLDDGSLVLHLSRPPWYSKQLVEALASSHSADARMWRIEDTWARQTDMVTYTPTYQELNSIAVALPKHLNTINIFRWTTFRFRPSVGAENETAMQSFLNALRDWNVKVSDGRSFRVVPAQADLERATWRLINGTYEDHSQSSLDQELARTQLPFSVRYQLEVCLSHGWLSEYSITTAFLENLARWGEAEARQALVYVATNRKRVFDPMTIFTDLQYSKPVRAKRLPDNCVEIHSATVTATGILFHTPSVEITNRIIRKHKSQVHRFLRVRFEDDNYRGQTKLYASTNNKMITIFTRVKRALTRGIKLGDITYDFLAWGNSQLREHGAYYVAASSGMNADTIRQEMGSFKETVVAKKAARMGQCFSTTRPVRLPSLQRIEEKTLIPDIKRNGYLFTDGVGKISEVAANLVSSELKIKGKAPCLFQFRLGGCKGVLAVSKDVPGIGIQIRDSQFKFNSLSGELEIIRWAEYWQPYLNRQIIICLSQLGVPNDVFQRMQQQTIDALEQAMYDDGAASPALRSNVDPNMMTLSICELVDAGFRAVQEPFVTALLHLWRAWSLRYLKEKAKIPVERGAFVLGCVDETATLRGHTSECPSGDIEAIKQDPSYLEKLPEIFIQITDMHTGDRKVIEGICILARNPSLHEGDIRVVRARNVPELRHMCDVVVMPQTGDRDLPSMCSGGDLDGDDYLVIWDDELIPRVWNETAFHYTPDKPKVVASEITTTHLIDFFHDYLRFDALGKIAHAHLGAADALEAGIKSEICHELVELHSKAVDYPKTGVPAKLERRLERDRWPHFMEKKGKSYKSYRVLGQLYDSVEKIGFTPNYDLKFDERILNACDTSKELLESLQGIKRDYDSSLNRILTQHSIQTEFELWSTFVLDHSKKSQEYKFHEEVGNLSKVLKEQYYEALCELAGGRDFEHLAPVAVAAYKLTQYQLELAKVEAKTKPEDSVEETAPMPFISFPWLLQETLIKIALHADNSRPRKTTATVESGQVVDQRTDMVVDRDGKGRVELLDISELNLGSSKLAQHLPDPLLANVTSPSEAEMVEPKEGIDAAIQPPATVNATSARSAVSTSVTDPAIETPPIQISRSCSADNKEPWPIAEREPELPTEYSLKQLTDEEIYAEFTALQELPTRTRIDGPLNIDTVENAGERASPGTSPLSPIRDELDNRPLPLPQSVSPIRHKLGLTSTIRSKKKAETCFYWKHGRCQYSEDECTYAHHNRATPREKEQITCWFWNLHGTCRHSDEDCKYAHRDTGVTVPPPDFQYLGQVVSIKSAAAVTRNHSTKRRTVPSPTKRAVHVESDDEEVVERALKGPSPRKAAHAMRRLQADSDDEDDYKISESPVLVEEEANQGRSSPRRFSAEAPGVHPTRQPPQSVPLADQPIDLLGDDVPIARSNSINVTTDDAHTTGTPTNGFGSEMKGAIQRALLPQVLQPVAPPLANGNSTKVSAPTSAEDAGTKPAVNGDLNGHASTTETPDEHDDLQNIGMTSTKMVYDDPLTCGDALDIDELSD